MFACACDGPPQRHAIEKSIKGCFAAESMEVMMAITGDRWGASQADPSKALDSAPRREAMRVFMVEGKAFTLDVGTKVSVQSTTDPNESGVSYVYAKVQNGKYAGRDIVLESTCIE